MKKTFSLCVLLCGLFAVAQAQLNFCVYQTGGKVTCFEAANVDSISFTSPETNPVNPTNTANNHEYVDLGLSVRWATCNIGAEVPEAGGDYYAWAELEAKDEYNWSTYKWCTGLEDTMTKYCVLSTDGKVDNKTVIEVADDAARANWGDRWRIPTQSEFDELIANCNVQWTLQNGVYGNLFTSKINGNQIFLPAEGCFSYYEVSAIDDGYYWSATLDKTNSNRAIQLHFNALGAKTSGSTRFYGHLIRPVLP